MEVSYATYVRKKGENKTMKKALSLFLALVMIFSVSVCAFAADENGKKTADSDPVIMVRGMDFMNVKLDPNTKDERAINDFSVKTIAPAVFKTLFQLLLKRDKDGAIDTVLDCAYSILKFNTMDENGDPAYNSGMRDYSLCADRYPELLEGKDCELGMVRTWLETYEKKYVYYVSYDWRVDPFVVAEQINSAVTLALKNTGRKKVNIVCASMGGIMTMAYLSKYGYEKVSRCLFLSSTFCGAQVACDVFTGRLNITAENIYNYLSNGSANAFGKFAMGALYKTGALKLLTKLTDYILENRKDDIYDRVLRPVFGHCTTLWGLICADDYNTAMNFVFGSRDGVTKTFLKRTDALQAMMKKKDALLHEMVSNGVRINVISNYGSPVTPFCESSDFSGDTILEAYNTSGFATIAKFNKTLGDDYKAANPALLSPDNCVDLSSAVLPEYTYMIKNAPHVAGSYKTEYSDFVMYLLSTNDSPKAGTNPRYPQFMVSDFNKQTLKAFE